VCKFDFAYEGKDVIKKHRDFEKWTGEAILERKNFIERVLLEMRSPC
jgi:hypothetical protein